MSRAIFSASLRAQTIVIVARAKLALHRPAIISVAMCLAGCLIAVWGAGMIGPWCRGLTLLVIGGGLVWMGLGREAGGRTPPGPVSAVLERARRAP